MNLNPKSLDMAVIGGGPAGISACLELSKIKGFNIALFECEAELGGMPRTCHIFFGMRDFKRLYTGPAYARRLDRLIQKTSTTIYTKARVLRINPGGRGKPHILTVMSPGGLCSYESRAILLATGCFESPRAARRIPGSRPAGIFTTGALQNIVNCRHISTGRKALIIGSEHVSLSCVLTLRRAGTAIAGLVEEGAYLDTYPLPATAMKWMYGFPIYKKTSVKSIIGNKRVEAVDIREGESGKTRTIQCDTVVITGKFRPDAILIENTPIEQDPSTQGPVVDMNLMTSVKGIFAAGNILRGADMHDLCALEGKHAAKSILDFLNFNEKGGDGWIRISAERPIRFVVPQRIASSQIRKQPLRKLFPRLAVQMEHTFKNPTIEACSGDEVIWSGSFRKMIGNSRIPLPVEAFRWNRVVPENGIVLRIR